MAKLRFKTVLLVVVGLGLIFGGPWAQAAKKYYPPGFIPPNDEKLLPSSGNSSNATSPVIQAVPGPSIVKTVTSKPQDALTSLVSEQRWAEAQRLVEARLKKSPRNNGLQLLYAQVLQERGMFDAARKQAQTLRQNTRLPKITRAKATSIIGFAYLNEARQQKNLGNTRSTEQLLQTADLSFQDARKLQPGTPQALLGQAQVAIEQGRLAQAEKLIRQAAHYQPGTALLKISQASVLLAKNKPEEAMPLLFQLKQKESRNPQVYLLLAKAALNSNRTDDAIIHLKQLLEIAPEQTEALKLLSQAYERKMMPEDAQQLLEKAIALHPEDERSVEALLSLYDQQAEPERSLLLLKTLTHKLPEKQHYQLALLTRLNQAERWDEAYPQGVEFLSPRLEQPEKAGSIDDQLLTAFIESAYHKGKATVSEFNASQDPFLKKVMAYTQARLKILQESQPETRTGPIALLNQQRNLLALNPLSPLAISLKSLKPQTQAEWELALQLAYLKGDQESHQRFIQGLLGESSVALPQKLNVADRLLDWGDYAGAKHLLSNLPKPETPQAKALTERLAQAEQTLQEQQALLQMLPGKISNTTWEKVASTTLQLSNAQWKTHALVAEYLERQKKTELSLFYQRLAAQYASRERDRNRLQKKINQLERSLLKKHS